MWDDARQLNATALMLSLLATVLMAWGVGAWAIRQPVFAIREVVVTGPLQRASAAHLEAVIRDEVAGTFFTLNLEDARTALGRVPWVRGVALRRQWPQRLEVSVEEHVPLARWNDAALVNEQGEVFAATFNGELPAFAGPEGRSGDVTSRFREWSTALAPLALSIQRIALSPRGGWQLATRGAQSSLQIELGREEPAARLQRFVAVHGRTLAAAERGGTRIEHVDLRYRNGFAARVPGFTEKPAPKPAA